MVAPQVSQPDSLQRFIDAQRDSYDSALAEIRRGRKISHWMWFIFPQIAGLGRSPTAQYYALASRAEGRAYLAHPLLGARLLDCVGALQDLTSGSTESIFGTIDAMKLRSSLTLFEAAGAPPMIAAALDRWFGSARDAATLDLIGNDD